MEIQPLSLWRPCSTPCFFLVSYAPKDNVCVCLSACACVTVVDDDGKWMYNETRRSSERVCYKLAIGNQSSTGQRQLKMLKKICTWRVRAVILFLFRLTARDSSSKVAYKEVRGREGLVCHQGRKKGIGKSSSSRQDHFVSDFQSCC